MINLVESSFKSVVSVASHVSQPSPSPQVPRGRPADLTWRRRTRAGPRTRTPRRPRTSSLRPSSLARSALVVQRFRRWSRVLAPRRDAARSRLAAPASTRSFVAPDLLLSSLPLPGVWRPDREWQLVILALVIGLKFLTALLI